MKHHERTPGGWKNRLPEVDYENYDGLCPRMRESLERMRDESFALVRRKIQRLERANVEAHVKRHWIIAYLHKK